MLAMTLAGSIAEALAHVNEFGQTVMSGGHPVGAQRQLGGLRARGASPPSAWRGDAGSRVAVLAVTLTCVVAYSLLGYVNGTALLDVMIALYTVATMVPSRDALDRRDRRRWSA